MSDPQKFLSNYLLSKWTNGMYSSEYFFKAAIYEDIIP